MSENKISNGSMIIEHQQIEALLQKFNKSKLNLVEEFDYQLYPFVNESFIGKYKYELNKPINRKDYLLLRGHINIDNAHIFYKYIDDETKYNFRQNIQVAHNHRWKDISNFLKKEGLIFETDKGMDYSVLHNNFECERLKLDDTKDLDTSITYYKNVSYFGIKDELKPLDDYIEEIKNSDLYKTALNKKLSDVSQEESGLAKILKQYESRDFQSSNSIANNYENKHSENFFSETQKKQILEELNYHSWEFPICKNIIEDINEKGIYSEYISVTDPDNQQICIKLNEDNFLYSQQCLFFYDYDLSKTDVKAYISEVLNYTDYEDDIENDISAYYSSLDELKKSYGTDYKQIALECVFENMATENAVDIDLKDLDTSNSNITNSSEINKRTHKNR